MKTHKHGQLTFAIGLAILMGIYSAASFAEETDQDKIDEIDEVVVVGSRRAPRSVADSAVPVDVISVRDLETQGSSDMLDVLTSVVPSYNVNREAISDAATLIRPANLRGLPSDNTLVLVNGKRRHRAAVIGEFVSNANKGAQGPDIYPLAGIALKQIEVLRDGAAAQYGSDAIAGVMNFILQDDPEIKRLQIQQGSYYEGDGKTTAIAGIFGTHLGQDGFATMGFEIKDSNPTSRGSQDPAAQNLIDNGNTAVANPVVIWGSPEVKNDYKFLFNAAVEAGNNELYGFGNWSSREVDGSFFYRNPNTRSNVFAFIDDNADAFILVADLTPGTVAEGGDGIDCTIVPVIDGIADTALLSELSADPNCFSYNEMFPGGFTPRFGGIVNDSSIVGGVRGEWQSGMTYDISLSAGRSEIIYRILNTINASYGPDTPTEFDLGSQIQFENILNADFTKPVNVGAASDLNVAFGLQYHEESFQIIAGQTESWAPGGYEDQGFSVGANGFQGFSTDVSGEFERESYSAYVDFEVDVTDDWLISTAFRYEDFSDFGNTFNAKLATRFRITDNFSLRAAASTGFRAPSIGQSNLRRAATTFSGGQLVESLTLPPTNPIAVLKGGKQLQPEESANFSIGTALSIGPVDLTLDWFQIEIEDRIALTVQNLTDEDRAQLINAGIVGANTVSTIYFFVNDFDTKTTGIDLVANWPFDWTEGHSNIALAYNMTNTEVVKAGATAVPGVIRELEDGLPQNRATVTFSHSTGGAIKGLVRINYLDEVYENLFNDANDGIETAALTLVDVELTWDFDDTYSIALGAKNIFDEQPDKHRHANQAGYLGADYPLNHPAGFNGGSYYLRLNMNF